MPARDLADRIAYVVSVQAKILLVFPTRDFSTFDDDPGQRRIQWFEVVKIYAAHGDRQRDPTGVHQQAALASFFPPCRSGSDRRIR